MSRKPTVIDCFCGAGGLSLGFSRSGFDIIYAFDYDHNCVETYSNNLSHICEVGDIKDISKTSIEKSINKSLNGIVDVIIGGPPCQGFSVQRRGSDTDSRNELVREYVRLVLEVQPRFFVMENVGGLLSKRGKPFMDYLKLECSNRNYKIHTTKLDAFDFGVPQIRKRVFIVGENTGVGNVLFDFHKENRNAESPKTVRDAIFDLMSKTEEDIPNHKSDKLSPINLERIRSIREGEGRDSLPEHLQLPCHRKNNGHRHLDVYGRMSWDKPSPTITARFDSFSRGRFGHPELDRTITLREGARLQSFPDNFIFYGSKVQIAKQIGNAVPPLLAKEIAEKVKEFI